MWMYAALLMGWIVSFFLHRLTPLYRAFIRILLPYYRWHLRMKPNSVHLSKSVAALQFAALYNAKAPWSEFVPYLKNFSVKRRGEFAEYLFYLFWINERFDEAKEACDYWKNAAYLRVTENESDARLALNFLRKVPNWKPGYKKLTQASFETAIKNQMKANRLGGFRVESYRNAKLAGLILEWLKEQDYAPAITYLQRRKINRHPPLPPNYYFSRDFGYSVLQELGMDDNTFFKLCRQAEQF